VGCSCSLGPVRIATCCFVRLGPRLAMWFRPRLGLCWLASVMSCCDIKRFDIELVYMAKDTITDTDMTEKQIVDETMANESAVEEDEANEGTTDEAEDDVVEKVAAVDEQAMATVDEQVAEANERVVEADEVSM
ncbi:unnamed protein product, partial [Prunus brigantina]